MNFDTSKFLIFFLVILVFYYFVVPRKYRTALLLLTSYYFYSTWSIKYIALLIVSTVITYGAALGIKSAATTAGKRLYLVVCLVVNVGLLGFFKYFNFISASVVDAFNFFNVAVGMPDFRILLPVGISFYTFKSTGYLIDVYRGKVDAERNFVLYSLFVSFFPQLVAGPIDRATNLFHQLREDHDFDYNRIMSGLALALWGFFKKLVIADRVSILVNTVYNDPHSYTGVPLLLATFLYAFQLYCDFSGYSDIAIGLGEMLGYRFLDNFERPYYAATIREYWQRWHMSLSTWFRDYLYIPLGGSRVSSARRYFNLFITFVVSGLWHGADWKFVIWGGLHGIFLILSYIFHDVKEKIVRVSGYYRIPVIRKALQMIMVFLIVDFAYIFFRANTFPDSIYIIRNLFTGIGPQLNDLSMVFRLGLSVNEFIVLAGGIILMETAQIIQERGDIKAKILSLPPYIRWALLYSLIVITVFFRSDSSAQFIYFQF